MKIVSHNYNKAFLNLLFFFYTHQTFVFHFLVDFCIVQNHIVSFFLFLLQKDFDIFHKFFCIFNYYDNIQLMTLQLMNQAFLFIQLFFFLINQKNVVYLKAFKKVDFIMIYKIHTVLVFIKITQIILKIIFSNTF